jgi:hypothetical protein
MARISLLANIDDTKLDSTNVSASSESEYDYTGSTTYSSGDTVKVSYEDDGTTALRPIKIYESLANSNTGNYPPDNPSKWVDKGPTNRWAMFDKQGITQTENETSIEVEIDASDMTMLALFGVDGNQVEITHYDESTSPRTEVWSETVDLLERNTTTWSEYFFGEFYYTRQYLKYFDAYSDSTLAITLTGTTAKCSQCLIGQWYNIGNMQWGMEVQIQDFSRRSTNDFGEIYLKQGSYVKKLNGRLYKPSNAYNAVYRSFNQIRAIPVVIDANGNDTEFDILRFFGFVQKYKPTITNPSQNQYRIQARGLI